MKKLCDLNSLVKSNVVDFTKWPGQSMGLNLSTVCKSPSRSLDFVDKILSPVVVEKILDQGSVKICDIACGTMDWLPHFSKRFQTCFKNDEIEILGTELLAEMIDVAKAKIKKTIHSPKVLESVDLSQDDFRYSKLKNNSQDIIMANNVAIYSPVQLLTTIYSKLRPGGKAIINFRPLEDLRAKKQAVNIRKELTVGRLKVPLYGIDRTNSKDEYLSKTGVQYYFSERHIRYFLKLFMGFRVLSKQSFSVDGKGSIIFEIQKPEPST